MRETAEWVPEVEGDLSSARKIPQELKPSLSFIPLLARVTSCPDTSCISDTWAFGPQNCSVYLAGRLWLPQRQKPVVGDPGPGAPLFCAELDVRLPRPSKDWAGHPIAQAGK